MFDEDAVPTAKQMYQDGRSPAEILRCFALSRPDVSVPDLMQLMRDAFSLPYEAVQCIGGWWYDGTSELTDYQINEFLITAINGTSRHLVRRQPPYCR